MCKGPQIFEKSAHQKSGAYQVRGLTQVAAECAGGVVAADRPKAEACIERIALNAQVARACHCTASQHAHDA